MQNGVRIEIDCVSLTRTGVDYIKQDNCGEYALGMARFQAFADAVNRTGKKIAISTEPFSIITNPLHSPFANLWRTGWGTIHRHIYLFIT
jgi:hypothetical protein